MGISIADIQRAVCECFGLPMIEMESRRKGQRVARPRQVAMFLAAELTPCSLIEIGRRFGGRDHTTVIHARDNIGRLIGSDASLADAVVQVRSRLANPDQMFLPWKPAAASPKERPRKSGRRIDHAPAREPADPFAGMGKCFQDAPQRKVA